MWLRKVEQLSQRAVAERLGIQEKAVEKQVSRGMRLLAQALLEGSSADELQDEAGESESETEHG